METDETAFYSPLKETEYTFKDNLPHAHQKGVYQYVTFRLADSLPKSVCQELNTRLEKFKEMNPTPWTSETLYQYRNLIGKLESRLLDKGYGSCILKNPSIRAIVEKAIHHNDGKKYDLLAYVIMPNHVHLLIRLREEYTVTSIIQPLKSFTAHQINKESGHKGPIWMKRYYDRMVRNPATLEHYIKYISCNPGHLPPTAYTLYLA